MRRQILIILSLVCCILSEAQTIVRGVVEDSVSHERLRGASVSYLRKGKTLKFARTNEQGQFAIQMDRVEHGDQLSVTMIGYDKRRCRVPVDGVKSVTVALPSRAFQLKEVQVQGSRVTGRDTITYDLTRFATDRDNSLKDVLKKLPGVDVSKNGMIAYNGKQISRFTVEGLDLTGGRYNQLTENIRAKDVKKAEIVEHDQPIKALEKRVYTDDVGMNITLKDGARDRLMATLRPYVLFDEPIHAGGSVNVRQIGKKKQRMYDVAYDRKGQNISESYLILGSNWNRLSAGMLPSWYTIPSLSAPVDADLLRFNTSQRYAVNQVSKTKNDNEHRLSAFYSRSVINQYTSNTSIYYMDEESPVTTTEERSLTAISDQFSAEFEHRINKENCYGNEVLFVKAAQDDGLTEYSVLSQRMRVPQVDIGGSIYRLFPLHSGDQLTWKSILDYHHSVNDLYVNDDRKRIRTNLWHTDHLVEWTRKRGYWTREYEGGLSAQNTHVEQGNWHLSAYLHPSWQYKTDEFRLTMRPNISLNRFARQQKTLILLSPTISMNWQPSSRNEYVASVGYSESTGSVCDYAIDEYQRDYRTWYTATGIIPLSQRLSGRVEYHYKRPIRELFMNVSLTAARIWSNTTNDMQIVDGRYYYSLKELNACSNVISGGLSASKGFYDLHLKMNLDVDGSLSNGRQLSSGRWIDYHTQSLALTPKVLFSPSWGELEYEGDFSFSGNKIEKEQMTTFFNWTQRLTLTSTIDKVDLSWSMVHYRNELQEGNVMNVMLSNAAVTWRLKKIRLKAQLRNIFNKKDYSTTTYSGIAVISNSYVLRPRELLLSAEFNL